MSEPLTLSTADGLHLTAQVAPATGGLPRAGMVLCHPHPQMGGSMRSIVISALFAALPAVGVTCLRFQFRGVETSEGIYDHGDGERHDARAALAALGPRLPPDVPVVMMGWSFGADVALSVHDPALAGWLAVACPLRFVHDVAQLAADVRPKQLVLAANDEVRAPAEVAREVEAWTSTRVEVVGGASHFFVGRTDRLVELATAYVDELTGP